ncbi:methyl-accepting chemotaxis protein [Oscillospiraceae bacterium LTW-04]|nr:methyl-accepting chemotaxis protein [Oscillospiraceae bacterium MB24-C1]
MKNLSVGKKLIIGFGTVLFLLLLSIAIALQSVNSLNAQVELYGRYTLPDNTTLWSIRHNMVSAQRYMERAFIETRASTVASLLEQAERDGLAARESLAAYMSNQQNSDHAEQITQVDALLEQAGSVRRQISKLLEDPSESNRNKGYTLFLNSYVPPFDQAATILSEFSETAQAHATEQRIAAARLVTQVRLALIICGVVSLLLSVAIIIAIRKSILTPVNEIVSSFEAIARGNMQAHINYESRDEMGRMANLIRNSNAMQSAIMADVIDKFVKMSQGDLQIEVTQDYPGDFAVLKQTISSTVANLNHTMQTIINAAEQVGTGSEQVSSGAQALATGSTEQAAAVEDLTVSASKISGQAEENAANVEVATKYVVEAREGVNTGNTHMSQLTKAMENISTASSQIASITKVIEDIAFQTNILALNAAIEAARAGEAGKGFAVVADEVRNLAAKSAEAAKQTTDLVERSNATVVEGTEITFKTAQILQEVEQKAMAANESITKIKLSSAEQALAIEEIKLELSQVSSVIQTNAATAEENSATSEEMSAQATALREEVKRFKLKSSFKAEPLVPTQIVQTESDLDSLSDLSEKY